MDQQWSSVGPAGWRRVAAGWMHATWPGWLVLAVQFNTLAPTVTGEDSGEFITAAWHFGVPHPPGYPLWTMLCGTWLHVIPFGSVAWRANLFSAVCTAAAVVVLVNALRTMGFRAMVAGAAAAACGLSGTVWAQSVITEVYTLNLLITALLVWMVVRWQRSGNDRWLRWGSFCFGLGMSNHHIVGFAALGLACWAVWVKPALLRQWRLMGSCAALFAIGLLPHAYMLWAASRDVPMKWGETTTVAAVWNHVSRQQYKSSNPVEAQVELSAGLMAGRLYYGVRWIVRDFTPVLAPLLAGGMIYLRRRRACRDYCVLAAGMLLTCGVMYLYVGGPVLDRQDEFIQRVFLTPLALVAAIPLAGGLAWLLAAWRSARESVAASVYRWGRIAALVCVVASPLAWHYSANNMRHYWYADDHARNMLACMLPNAMIFPSGDHNTFPLIYLVHVEGVRPDVLIADKYGYIEPSLYADMPHNPGKPRTPEERNAIEEWLIRTARRPVYYTINRPALVEHAGMVAVGVLYHLLPDGQPLDRESCWDHIHYRNLEGTLAPEDHAAANIAADYWYAVAVHDLARGDRERAKRHFDQALVHAEGLKEVFNNVGSALAEAGMLDEAIARYEEAARMDWRYGAARWNLARIFKSAGHPDWSAKVFEDLTLAAPRDFRPYGELGFLFRDVFRDPDRARYWWYESLRINPAQPQIISALAELENRRTAIASQPSTPVPASSQAGSMTQQEATP